MNLLGYDALPKARECDFSGWICVMTTMLYWLKTLLWKNLHLRRANWKETLIEILLPIVIFTLTMQILSRMFNLPQELGKGPLDAYTQDVLYSFWPQQSSKIFYAPQTQYFEKIIEAVRQTLEIPYDDITGLVNDDIQKQMTNYQGKHEDYTIAGIVFHGNSSQHLKYSLSIYNEDTNWLTERFFYYDGTDKDTLKYIQKGFIALQLAIDMAYLQIHTNLTSPNIVFSLQELPDSNFKMYFRLKELHLKMLPLATYLSFTLMFLTVFSKVAEEKYSGMRVLLKIHGMDLSSIWCGWYIYFLMTNVISMLPIPALMVYYYDINYNLLWLFIFLFLFCTASFSMILFLSSLLHKPQTAATLGSMIWILSDVIPSKMLGIYDSRESAFPSVLRKCLCLLPTIALRHGFKHIFYSRNQEMLQITSHDKDDVNMEFVFLMLVAQTVLYACASFYIDGNIHFWKRKNRQTDSAEENLELQTRPRSITVENLNVSFGEENVLKGVEFSLSKNSVNVLLGQNGSGKSTLLSVIAGFIRPTSGRVRIDGIDISKNPPRESVGVCVQDNLLIKNLTVVDHLEFFARIKKLTQPQTEAHEMLKLFNLENKKRSLVQSLSEGMKRKLCVAIALLGNPKVILLDEPTAGIDVDSRRKLWNQLLIKKSHSTILMTTHSLEVANLFTDEVLQLKDGQIEVLKTLKPKDPVFLLELNNVAEFESYLKDNNVKIEIQRLSDTGTFKVQIDAADALFKAMEKMEYNFLEVTLTESFTITRQDNMDNEEFPLPEALSDKSVPTISLSAQFKALIFKRWFFVKKAVLLWHFPIFILGLIVFLVVLFLREVTKRMDYYSGHPLSLTLDNYDKMKTDLQGSLQLKEIMFDYYETVIRSGGSLLSSNLTTTKDYVVAGANFTDYGKEIQVNVLHSRNAIHSAPIAINLAVNALFKNLLGNDYTVHTTNRPLQLKTRNYILLERKGPDDVLVWLGVLPYAMLILLSNFVMFPFWETNKHFLQLQLLMGVSPWLYWTVNLLFDLLIFAGNLAIYFVVAHLIDSLFPKPNYGTDEYVFIFLMLVLSTASSLPFTYWCSKGKSVVRSYARFFTLGILALLLSTIVVLIFNNPTDSKVFPKPQFLPVVLLATWPQYGLSYWCFYFVRKYNNNFNWNHMESDEKNATCKEVQNLCCKDVYQPCNPDNYFDVDSINVVFTVVAFVFNFYIFLILPIHWSIITRANNCKRDSSDDGSAQNALEAKNVTKNYKKNKVLNHMELLLTPNKCCGLLGLNGAGKSTAFQVLTKNASFEGGTIRLNLLSGWVSMSNSKYGQNIGYCPQEDPLNPQLTGEEILRVVTMLRGFSLKQSSRIAEQFLEIFKLKNQQCSSYSGGGKRKISVCMALIGSPKIILLDEPSKGLDINSRKILKKVLSILKTQGSSLLLCTHHIEEFESVMDEMKLLQNGETSSLDKEKYKGWYNVTYQLRSFARGSTAESDNETLKEFKGRLVKISPLCKEDDERVICFVKSNLSTVFKDTETLRKELAGFIVKYTIKNVDLEDVFWLETRNSGQESESV